MSAHAEVVANIDPEHNKNHLNSIHQRLFHNVLLEYKYSQPGQGHNPPWQCTVHLDGVHIGTGWGIKQQYASEAAAESAIDHLHLKYHKQNPDAFR